ncbi:hypothetical protein CBL_05121 [Carabus blaptoides fortunei]
MASEKCTNTITSEGSESNGSDFKTSNVITKPSSPRQFFARLYGHLEDSKNDIKAEVQTIKEGDICRPQPLISSGLEFPVISGTLGSFPFTFPPGDDTAIRLALTTSQNAHFAGFSAFRK